MEIREIMGMPKAELAEKHQELIRKLKDHLVDHGDMRLVQKIIKSIEMGFPDSVKTLCFNEADKFRSHPELIEMISSDLFDEGEPKPWGFAKRK